MKKSRDMESCKRRKRAKPPEAGKEKTARESSKWVAEKGNGMPTVRGIRCDG